jgi:Uma2 family endonuclease
MSIVVEQSGPKTVHELDSTSRRYHELSEQWDDVKIEVISGRIVVRELPTDDHNNVFFQLFRLLMTVAVERGWKLWPDINLFLGAQSDHYRPDLTVVPREPRMWGNDHVHGDNTLLVVEIVSERSKDDDHTVKPRGCAAGKVPLYMVIDTFDAKVRLLSHPGADGYARQTEVKLGEKLELPEPWNITLDTGELTD